MITSVYGKPGEKETVDVPDDVHIRVRMGGWPQLNQMTLMELQYAVIYYENEAHKQQQIVWELLKLLSDDVPWPPGIGYWDGITKAQNQAEHDRRVNARV